MTYSEEWNDIYARGEQMVCWPWSDLVSLVKRHCGNIKKWSVLELGCGPTAPNAAFFIEEDAHYYWGIDSCSPGRDLSCRDYDFARFSTMDFTKELPGHKFDLIVDRAAVTHNDTESIKRCLGLAYDALKPGGYYIGIDWFSMLHADSGKGDRVDMNTKTNIPYGQFKGVGKVHFTTYTEIKQFFNAFNIVHIEHKDVSSITSPVENPKSVASYNIVARKP